MRLTLLMVDLLHMFRGRQTAPCQKRFDIVLEMLRQSPNGMNYAV
jgi:hypothetical protein